MDNIKWNSDRKCYNFWKTDPNNLVYGSFLPILEQAVTLFKGDVLEFGSGHNSTPFLCDFLSEEDELYTFEYDLTWYENIKNCKYHTKKNHNIYHIKDWQSSFIYEDDFYKKDEWSVIFIDHSPGERRIEEIKNFINKCDIMLIHDFNADSMGGAYGWSKVYDICTYCKEIPAREEVPYPSPSTAIVSNKHDINNMKWSIE